MSMSMSIKAGINRLIGVGLLSLILSACVSTTTNEPEKWGPQERAEAHVKLGLTYLRQHQYETASSEFDDAIEINPESDTAHHAKGLLMSRVGNNSQASEYLAKAVAMNPKNYLAVNDYGIHLCQSDSDVSGIELLNGIENDPANPYLIGTRLGLGICHAKNKNDSEASRYLRSVINQSPSLPQALLPMAEISFRTGKFLSARAFLERYFGTGSLSRRSLFLAAKVEYQLGAESKANQYRRELRKRFPNSFLNEELDELSQ